MSTTAADSIAGVETDVLGIDHDADVLEYFDPSFGRDDFVDIIRNNCWPE